MVFLTAPWVGPDLSPAPLLRCPYLICIVLPLLKLSITSSTLFPWVLNLSLYLVGFLLDHFSSPSYPLQLEQCSAVQLWAMLVNVFVHLFILSSLCMDGMCDVCMRVQVYTCRGTQAEVRGLSLFPAVGFHSWTQIAKLMWQGAITHCVISLARGVNSNWPKQRGIRPWCLLQKQMLPSMFWELNHLQEQRDTSSSTSKVQGKNRSHAQLPSPGQYHPVPQWNQLPHCSINW